MTSALKGLVGWCAAVRLGPWSFYGLVALVGVVDATFLVAALGKTVTPVLAMNAMQVAYPLAANHSLYLSRAGRNALAEFLLAAGVPERVVIEILGHSTLAMVKRYQHVLPGLPAAAVERRVRVMGR